MTARYRTRPGVVALGSVLVVMGVLAIFSIGFPILVLGLLVLAAGLTDAHRRRPRVFWPFVAATAVFFAGYVLVAPLSCTSHGVARDGGQALEVTDCTNLVGIGYSGGAGYDPPLWPAVGAGIIVAVAAAGITRRFLTSGTRSPAA